MKKRGFTLIELLAVIVILAIIALIAVPTIINIITKARKAAFKDSAYGIIKAGELYYAEKLLDPEGTTGEAVFEFPDNIGSLPVQGKLPSSGQMKISSDGDIAIAISDGRYCAKKEYTGKDVTIDEDLENCSIPVPASAPELKEGMIPVVIENDGTVKKANVNGEWYNYNQKKWANVVTVSEATRATHTAAKVGEVIPEGDILTYLVWIPRYKYKLWYTEATDGSSTKDTSKVHSIDIVFESKETAKSTGSTNGTYLTHPAFTFGTEELNGIWVGKFEAGYAGAESTSTAQVGTADSTKVVIKPNTYSWREIAVSNAYTTVKGMNATGNVFGLTTATDTHMMKNTEWGAVAYLSHSKYGKGSEVYINNNSAYMTGCGGDSASEGSSSTCKNAYGSKSDGVYNQSTTGNITGIFDMSGGAWEYVMGYTTGATTKYGISGFSDATFPDAKYVDTYDSTTSTQYSKRKLGDATGEMGPFASIRGSWYEDCAYFVQSSSPWFRRGGYYDDSTSAGVFYFLNSSGGASHSLSFRVVAA